MKNAFLRLLRYLNLVARKEDPLVSANTPDFMRSVVSDSLGDNGHWKLIEAVNDSNFDVSKPIGEAAKDAGYHAIPLQPY